jgi:hypothetical protein
MVEHLRTTYDFETLTCGKNCHTEDNFLAVIPHFLSLWVPRARRMFVASALARSVVVWKSSTTNLHSKDHRHRRQPNVEQCRASERDETESNCGTSYFPAQK